MRSHSYEAALELLRKWEQMSESFDTRADKGMFALAAAVNDLGDETRAFLAAPPGPNSAGRIDAHFMANLPQIIDDLDSILGGYLPEDMGSISLVLTVLDGIQADARAATERGS